MFLTLPTVTKFEQNFSSCIVIERPMADTRIDDLFRYPKSPKHPRKSGSSNILKTRIVTENFEPRNFSHKDNSPLSKLHQ